MSLPRPASEAPTQTKAKTIGRPKAESTSRLTARDKVAAVLDDPAVSDLGSFLHMFYRIGSRDRKLPNRQELGHLLAYLRESGRLSPEIDGFMADQLADAVLRRLDQDLDNGKPLVPQIERLAQTEPADQITQRTVFETYRVMAKRARQIEAKVRLGKTISDEERDMFDDFKAFQFLVADETPPATLVAHFVQNGDLKWLWGLDKKIDLRQLKLKTQGGKLGGRETAEW